MFRLAQYIVDELICYSIQGNDDDSREWGALSRPLLFPQVYAIVKKYVACKVDFNDMNMCELGIAKYFGCARQSLLEAIVPDEHEGATPLLPHFRLGKRIGTTRNVNLKTIRECYETKYSHINLVALDSGWERSASMILDQSVDKGIAKHYARIYKLMEFTIPCGTIGDNSYHYMPDFLVRMSSPKGEDWTLILEIKGREDEKRILKHAAAERWVAAVNNWGKLGKWGFHVCDDPNKLAQELKKLHKDGPDTRPDQTT